MSIFSKERIEQFIAQPLEFGLTRGEQMEMAKELLELRSLYASATECYLEQVEKVDAYESPVSFDDAVAKFREYNIGFPVERFKADYVIGWMLANYLPAVRTDARTLSESEWNKLQGLIEAPPAPSQKLRDLMTRNPRYTTQPKSEHLQRAEKLAEDAAALAERISRGDTPRPYLTGCAAGRDGECSDPRCPQLRDDEPASSGRHCPLDVDEEDE